MSKPVTIICPSYCPDETVKGYETRCLSAIESRTPRSMYDLIVMRSGDWSYPQKVNAAMSGVKTDYAIVLSNDVFVRPGWIEALLHDYQVTKECAIMSPVEVAAPGEISRDDHWWALILWETWKFYKVGLLDESLPNVYHDQDWSIRAKRHGFDVCRTGNVVVEHIGSATRSRVGTMDDAEERAEMIRRYGCAELHDYVRLNANSVSK